MNTRQSMQLNPLWQYISGLYNINFDVDIDFFLNSFRLITSIHLVVDNCLTERGGI